MPTRLPYYVTLREAMFDFKLKSSNSSLSANMIRRLNEAYQLNRNKTT